MSIPARLKALLDKNSVRYTAITHSPAYTAQAAAEAMHVPGKELAKTVVLRAGEEETILAVLPASAHVNLRELSVVVGKPLRLATEKEFAGLFPDCELGAMPPFGELYNLPVYVDESLASDIEIVFNAGTHHEAIRMRFEDFARMVRPVRCSFGEKGFSSRAAARGCRATDKVAERGTSRFRKGVAQSMRMGESGKSELRSRSQTVEIPRKDWSAFLTSFSRRHEGWLVTLEVMGADLGSQVEAENQPLAGIAAESREDRTSCISIFLGRKQIDITHTIQEPKRLWLKTTAGGADEALEIETVSSPVTLLRFRSPMLPEMVDDILR